jgi:hypothetical protein
MDDLMYDDYIYAINSNTIYNTIQDYTQYNYDILPQNTYWFDQIVNFVNNILYDEDQLTNSQYDNIIDFLNQINS